VSSTRKSKCLFCGRTAALKAVTTVQVDCPDCGRYELTLEAINHLRLDTQAKASVRAEIRRQLDSGVERPQISLEVIRALKAHKAQKALKPLKALKALKPLKALTTLKAFKAFKAR
jgi:hypothetical protein